MVNGGKKSKQPLLGGGGGGGGPGGGGGGGAGGGSASKSQSKYMRLENQTDTPLSQSGSDVMPRGISMTSANGGGVAYSRSAGVFDDIHQQQQMMMTSQVGTPENRG